MLPDYAQILNALIAQGFQKLQDADIYDFDYKITAYSLNTKLSFRFDNLDHFLSFLRSHQAESAKGIEVLYATFSELGLDPNQFFWVNFFEKGKEVEM